MPAKKYIVELNNEERQRLKQLINTGKVAAYQQRHARILLLTDEGFESPKMTDAEVAQSVGCGRVTVERVRKRLVSEGLEIALERHKNHPGAQRLLDGDAEAHLIALACGQPPEGRNRWTMRLLAQKMVSLDLVEHSSKDTVQRTLKKTNLSLGATSNGAFRRRLTANLSGGWKTS